MQGVKILTSVLFIVCFGLLACYCNLSLSNPLNAPDLPGFSQNYKNVPAGSLIIPMDSLQIHDPSGLQSLLPYGLIIRTLYQNVSVQWAIATGKPSSGADFTATTKPTLFGTLAAAGTAASDPNYSAVWGNSASSVTYYGGPFIIQASNVVKALTAYNKWKQGGQTEFRSVANNVYDKVVVHIVTQSLTVDVRHTINSKPFVAVSNLDGNAATQTAMLGCIYQNSTRACPREDGSGWGSSFGNQAASLPCTAFAGQDHAGLEFGTHYITYDCGADVTALTTTTCLATFSEPHWEWTSTNGPTYISSLKTFISSGANFLAQCASTFSYENYGGQSSSSAGTFLSESGLYPANPVNGVNYQSANQLKTITNYPDLPIAQYVGPISSAITGAVPDFYMLFGTPNDAPPSSWKTPTTLNSEAGYNNFKPNTFPIATNVYDSTSTYSGRNLMIAGGTKYNMNNPLGSNIFYLGGHTWAGVTTAGTDNGRRLLMNAILIPALRPPSCGFSFCNPGEACTPRTACETCKCDPSGSTFVYTPIAGCCLNNAGCTGDCQFCNSATGVNKCQLTPGCCSVPAGINCTGQCQTCSSTTGAGTCTSQAGCCKSNADCTKNSSCVACTNSACIRTPAPACCDSNADCNTQTCYVCSASLHTCVRQQPTNSCCLVNSDCGSSPCQICDTTNNVCVKKPGCCDVDKDCGTSPCAQCLSNSCVRKEDCCENSQQCGACTFCSNSTFTCQASLDAACCTTDADCGSCKRCADATGNSKTCLAISDCCLTSADCEVCQNCTANQCTVIDSCCRFDADCTGCLVCEDYTCQEVTTLSCCQSDQDCETAAQILRANGTDSNDTISDCPYHCQIPSGSTTGSCTYTCTTPKSYTGLIVGLAVGIPLGLLALLALAALIALLVARKRDALMTKFVRKDPNMGGDAQSNPLHVPNVKVHTTPL